MNTERREQLELFYYLADMWELAFNQRDFEACREYRKRMYDSLTEPLR